MAGRSSLSAAAPARRRLRVMTVISALFEAQTWMLSPLVALHVLHLGYGLCWLGAIISAPGAFQFALQFAEGVIADRLGKKMLHVALIAVMVASLLFAFTTSLWVFLLTQLSMRTLNLCDLDHLSEALRTNLSGGKTVAQMIADAAHKISLMSLQEVKRRINSTESKNTLLDVHELDVFTGSICRVPFPFPAGSWGCVSMNCCRTPHNGWWWTASTARSPPPPPPRCGR